MNELTISDNLSISDSVLSTDKEAQELAYGMLSEQEILKHVLKKGARGFAKLTVFGKEDKTYGTPNLVLLNGREFLAQKLADIPQSTDVDTRDYRIRYFGYGSGGAQEGTGTVPNKMGPFDDDTGLYAPATFSTGSTDADSQFKYINDGKLKLIRTDYGNISIEEEEHTINKGSSVSGTGTTSGSSVEVTINRYTAIKYTMFIMSYEFIKPSTEGAITNNPFAFNEAALYAVDTKLVMNEDGVTYKEVPKGDSVSAQQNPNHLPFARFTTSTKWIEEGESLKIEWFILV